MIPNQKALGLALAALFAFGAISASAASAQNGRLTSDGSVTLDMTEIEGEPTDFTIFNGTTECPGSTFTGHKYNVTPHEFIPSGAEAITITPDFNQMLCRETEGGVKRKLTVTMNECDFVLHIGETTAEADTYSTTLAIVCPEGKSIVKDVYLAEENENIKICERTIGPQTGLGGVTINDTTAGDLELHGTYSGVHESKSGICGAESTEAGAIDMNLTVRGTNEVGEFTEIGLSHL